MYFKENSGNGSGDSRNDTPINDGSGDSSNGGAPFPGSGADCDPGYVSLNGGCTPADDINSVSMADPESPNPAQGFMDFSLSGGSADNPGPWYIGVDYSQRLKLFRSTPGYAQTP